MRIRQLPWIPMLGAAAWLVSANVRAATPDEIQKQLAVVARESNAAFGGFSAQRGQRFFESTHGNDWSCATCHTRNLLARGKHATTAKEIAPFAPAVNPQRFSEVAKVEKWFGRNCNDVLKRPCTAQEKGDIIAYALSFGR